MEGKVLVVSMQAKSIRVGFFRPAPSLARGISRLTSNNAPTTLGTFSSSSRLKHFLPSRMSRGWSHAMLSSTPLWSASLPYSASSRACDEAGAAPCVNPAAQQNGAEPEMKKEEEESGVAAMFFTRPLPERLAAITVARFTASAGKERAAGERADKRPPAAMPLKLFMEQIPAATREAIQQSRQDVTVWVRRTALLELIPQDDDDKNNGGRSPEAGLVRVRHGAALDVLKATQWVENVETPAAAPTPAAKWKEMPREAAEESAGTSEQQQALLATLDGFLRCEHVRTKRRYCFLNRAYLGLMRDATEALGSPQAPFHAALQHLVQTLQFADFESLVLQDKTFQERFWVLQERFITWRDPDERTAPRFENSQHSSLKAGPENNYGGWGSATAVPTCEDVAEILKYIPVNWGNMGNLGIPPAIKKARIRSSSLLQWLRRQPYYFEVRNMAGTTEVRRSVVLHPEAHGITPEEAREQLHLAIASGKANNLILLGADGRPLPEEISVVEKAIRRFFYRVCPPYFAPLSLVMQRYTKKNLTEDILLNIAKRFKDDFEVYVPRYAGVPLVRRRVGADSSRWKKDFVEDLERHPADVQGIIAVMNRLCSVWDRPEYVYVRLSSTEQQHVGGYSGMVEILQRHPAIFRIGSRFVCRVDASDPLAQAKEEPSGSDMTSRAYLRDENPYLSPLDVAKVFHYVAPLDKSCSPAFFVECASPAMLVALPPRIITILQQFPRLFACRETSPGVYSVRKLNAPTATAALREGELDEQLHAGAYPGSVVDCGSKQTDRLDPKTAGDDSRRDGNGGQEDDGDSSWLLESEIAAEANLSRTDVIEAIKALIPPNGVESANLLFWASMNVQHAANHHYGGLIKMVETEKKHFRVVDSADYKMIYCA